MAPVVELIEILSLLTEKVTSLPSASEAVTVPTSDSFSSTLKVEDDVNAGALSLRLFISGAVGVVLKIFCFLSFVSSVVLLMLWSPALCAESTSERADGFEILAYCLIMLGVLLSTILVAIEIRNKHKP